LFKGLGNIGTLMRQAQQMGNQMQGITEHLKTRRAVGNAGGGMVEVEVNGLGEVLRVTIEIELVQRGDREMIEDLLPSAVNQAVTKSRQMHAEAMQQMTEGLNVPGLNEAIQELSGGVQETDGTAD